MHKLISCFNGIYKNKDSVFGVKVALEVLSDLLQNDNHHYISSDPLVPFLYCKNGTVNFT